MLKPIVYLGWEEKIGKNSPTNVNSKANSLTIHVRTGCHLNSSGCSIYVAEYACLCVCVCVSMCITRERLFILNKTEN